MKVLFLSLVILLSPFSWSRYDEIEGEGRFYSRDEDTLAFIKKQLIASAYRDIFTKELRAMNLDSEKFWGRYEDKFTKYFKGIENSIRSKYSKGEGNPITDKKQYEIELRRRKLALKSSYGRFSRAIPKFSIKKMSRSPQVPNSRYIRLKAQVDRKEINKIYLEFTSNNLSQIFTSLYLNLNLSLENSNWNETGVEIESDYKEVLTEHWKDKLEKALTHKVQKVIIPDSDMIRKLEEFSHMNLELKKNFIPNEDLGTSDNPIEKDDSYFDFGTALWLTINIKIKKISENKDLKKRVFEFHSDLILQDVGLGKIIFFKDFDKKIVDNSYEKSETLRNSIATTLAQIPSPTFNQFAKKLVNLGGKRKKVIIEVSRYDTLGGIDDLIRKLGEVGITKHFTPYIESFSSSKVRLILEYSGGDKEMISILKSLEGKKLNKGKYVHFPTPSSFFDIALLGEEYKRIPMKKEEKHEVKEVTSPIKEDQV